jgi:hypothetical protein
MNKSGFRRIAPAAFSLLLLWLPSLAFSQSDRFPAASALLDLPVRVTTTGRDDYQGRLHAILEDRVELVLADGQIIQIASSEIERIDAIDLESGRRGLFQDAATNRLMVMPTGFPMAKGEFHVSDQELVVVTGSYGLTNNLSLWAGISIPGLVLSGRWSFHLTPSIGASAGTFVGVEWISGNALLLPYALVSFGSPNRNVTAGGAAVFSTANSGFDGAVAALGGKFVITPTTAIVTEHWFIWVFEEAVPYPTLNVLGVSFRIAGSRLSWDIGAVVPIRLSNESGTFEIGGMFENTIIPLPLISLTYRID